MKPGNKKSINEDDLARLAGPSQTNSFEEI